MQDLSKTNHKINKMNINTSELTEFINSVSKEIFAQDKDGIKTTIKPIEFELSVVVKKAAGGKINLLLADVGGKYEKEVMSKIKFSVYDERQYVEDVQMDLAKTLATKRRS